ncbi:hypothetical protein ACH5RR_032183 [Cinchona calisaya]|uniref:Uncharacterized protein n=1 Tax=Cinchona calisaya TaxID=153742 RepID=A0ABD2YJC0_9GENT
MAFKDVSSKVAGKSSSTARSDDAFSVDPWTRSKSKAVATIVDHFGDNQTRTRTIITLGARKDESSESKKLASISENSMSNEILHDKSYASSVEEQLAAMACVVEKLSKTIKENDLKIVALVSKLESQNIGETSQVNNKSDPNPQMDESAKVYFGSSSRHTMDDSMNLLAIVNNKSDQNPQMDESAKVYFGSSSRHPVDDSMNLLAIGAMNATDTRNNH